MQKYSDGNLVQSAILSKEYDLLVADRNNAINHPAIASGRQGIVGPGGGSIAGTKSLIGLGSGVASPSSEDGAVTPTDYSFADVTVTSALKRIARSSTDIARLFDATGVLSDPAALAFDAAMVKANTIMAMTAELGASFAQDAGGSSGAALTWATLRAAKNKVVEGDAEFADGDMLAIIHNRQWRDLETDSAGLSAGVLASSQDAYQSVLARKAGYQGRYFGVDIFTSNRVPYANGTTDRRGTIIVPGAIAWENPALQADPHGFIDMLEGGALQLEYSRDASRMIKAMYINFLYGNSLAQEALGCTVTSRAA